MGYKTTRSAPHSLKLQIPVHFFESAFQNHTTRAIILGSTQFLGATIDYDIKETITVLITRYVYC